LFSLSRFSRRRCGFVAPHEISLRVESRVAGVVIRPVLRLAKRFSVSPPAGALSESLLRPDNCAAGSLVQSIATGFSLVRLGLTPVFEPRSGTAVASVFCAASSGAPLGFGSRRLHRAVRRQAMSHRVSVRVMSGLASRVGCPGFLPSRAAACSRPRLCFSRF
jgi:hypothetical protein